MAVADLAILGLTGVALPWAIIELGLSAYFVNGFREYFYRNNIITARFNFLLFDSVWTILVAAFLLAAPFVLGRNGQAAPWVAYVTLTLNVITMIFWLAGFAAFADLYGGVYNPTGIAGALLAFAVMLWLIFLALTVLNFLTCFGVLRSERAGYTPFTAKTGTTSTTTTTTAGPQTSTVPTTDNSVPLANTTQPTAQYSTTQYATQPAVQHTPAQHESYPTEQSTATHYSTTTNSTELPASNPNNIA